jgi:hypothetical protein
MPTCCEQNVSDLSIPTKPKMLDQVLLGSSTAVSHDPSDFEKPGKCENNCSLDEQPLNEVLIKWCLKDEQLKKQLGLRIFDKPISSQSGSEDEGDPSFIKPENEMTCVDSDTKGILCTYVKSQLSTRENVNNDAKTLVLSIKKVETTLNEESEYLEDCHHKVIIADKHFVPEDEDASIENCDYEMTKDLSCTSSIEDGCCPKGAKGNLKVVIPSALVIQCTAEEGTLVQSADSEFNIDALKFLHYNFDVIKYPPQVSVIQMFRSV